MDKPGEAFTRSRLRNDIILFAVITAAALLLAALTARPAGGEKTGRAVVIRGGEEIGEYPLSEDADITITSDDGGTNRIEIRDGMCAVTEADCPDGICIRRGRISKNGETIVCLPHRLVIEIRGAEGSPDDPDTVAR